MAVPYVPKTDGRRERDGAGASPALRMSLQFTLELARACITRTAVFCFLMSDERHMATIGRSSVYRLLPGSPRDNLASVPHIKPIQRNPYNAAPYLRADNNQQIKLSVQHTSAQNAQGFVMSTRSQHSRKRKDKPFPKRTTLHTDTIFRENLSKIHECTQTKQERDRAWFSTSLSTRVQGTI